MIKSLNKGDIQVTPFVAEKEWNVQNIDDLDLILWVSGSEYGGISHTYIDYGDGTSSPITNSYCNLALEQQYSFIQYQRGLNITGAFFPVGNSYYTTGSNPVNADGTYMRSIYNMHKNSFYNTYNNPTQLFGIESLDVRGEHRILTDVIDVFTIPKEKFGSKIIPKSIQLVDNLEDGNYIINDDGKTNLILSGSYFSTFQEIGYESA